MKNNSIFLSLMSLVSAMFLAGGCGKCKDCRNKDCEGHTQEPDAAFNAYYRVNDRYFLEEDTLIATASYVFKSKYADMDYHKWEVLGAVPRNDNKDSVIIALGSSFLGRETQIMHTVSERDDRACYPNKNGRDTVIKTYYIKPPIDMGVGINRNSKLLGRWRGECDCFKGQQYTMTVQDTFVSGLNWYFASFSNVFPGAASIALDINASNYWAVVGGLFRGDTDVNLTPNGPAYYYVSRTNRDSMTAEFVKVDGPFLTSPKRNCKFMGVRIR